MTDYAIMAQPGTCQHCHGQHMVCTAYAIMLAQHEKMTLCGQCFERLRQREIFPQIRRLYVMGENFQMLQTLLPGQQPDQPPKSVSPASAKLITELYEMVQTDPNRGTEYESAYLDHTSDRTKAIGQALYDDGGHALMLAAHGYIRQCHGSSARCLEIAWDGIAEWFD